MQQAADADAAGADIQLTKTERALPNLAMRALAPATVSLSRVACLGSTPLYARS